MTAIAITITIALAVWRVVLRGKLPQIPRLPNWAQPIPPFVLAALAAAGEGYLTGLRGLGLAQYVAAQTGEVGAMAIGIWHTYKRVTPAAKATVAGLAALWLVGCGRPAQSPTTLDLATATVNVTDTALAAYIATAPEGQLATLGSLVGSLEVAASAIRRREDVCPIIPCIRDVAVAIDCSECTEMSGRLAGLLGCDSIWRIFESKECPR